MRVVVEEVRFREKGVMRSIVSAEAVERKERLSPHYGVPLSGVQGVAVQPVVGGTRIDWRCALKVQDVSDIGSKDLSRA